jgi:hypothetical protein
MCCNPNLGLTTKAKGYKVAGKKGNRESCHMFIGVEKSLKDQTLTLPRELTLWELESHWTFEFSESDCRGQNPLH